MSWPLVQISEFCRTGSGGTPSRKQAEFYNGNIPWIKSGDLREKTVIEASEFITDLGVQKSSAKIVPKGAILLAMYGATVGRMAMLGIDAATNQAVCSIIPDQDKAFPKYVYYALLSKVPDFLRNAVGGAQPNISQGKIKATRIPLPPLEEQKRIATILDKADAIRRKRQQAIQLADEFLRAVFLDMFGDPVTNPKGWGTSRIDAICKIVRGSSPRPKGDPRYYGGPVPRLMVADLTRDGKHVNAKIDSLTEEGAKKSRPTKKGTVVMAVSGNVGLTSILSADACIHDGFIAFNDLDSSVVLPEFLQEMMTFLKSTHANRQAGAIFQNLTTSQIKEMLIPIPGVHLQKKYLDVAVKVDDITKKKNGEIYCRDLFDSLSHKLFLGKV